MPRPATTMSVTMPDGVVVTGVPVDITQDELWERYQASKAPQPTPAAATPIDQALAAREQDVAAYQAKRQAEYAARRAAIQEQDKLHPEFAPNPLVAGEMPEEMPNLRQRKPEIAPREATPSKPIGSGFAAATKIGLLEDEQTKKRVLAATLFPDDPQGIYRVGFDPDGQPVYVGDDGKLHRIASGLSQFGATVLANTPETAAAAVGSLAGPGGAGISAATAHSVKRAIAGLAFDEPQTIAGNLKGMAVEGGTALAGEGLTRLGTSALNAGRRIDFTPADAATARAVQDRVLRTTGVHLNLADASDDPSIKGAYAYGMRQPGPAQRVGREARARADQEFHAATDRVLNNIANAAPSEQTGRAAINAARDEIEHATGRAQALADPYYERAYTAMPRIIDPQLMHYFQLPHFGEAFDAGQVTARLERQGLRPYQPPDLRSLDYMKRELDDRVRTLERTNPTQAGALRDQVGAFVRRLDEVSPDYRRARRVYRRAYRWHVRPLVEGKVGVLARIDDPQAATAAAQVLSDAAVSPEHVAQTRMLIERQNPQAWSGIVRQWLASKWDDALERTQTGAQTNRAGKLQKLVFGSPRDEAIAHAMLTPQQFQAFDDLMFAARRLGSTPTVGSITAHDLQMGKMLEGSTGRVAQVVNAVRSPFKTFEESAKNRAREQNIESLMHAITDPRQLGRLRVILRMEPGTRQAILLGGVMAEENAKRFVQSRMRQGADSHLIAEEDKKEEAEDDAVED